MNGSATPLGGGGGCFQTAGHRLSSRAALMAAWAAACWPVARWYVLRITDGSDEPWGLAALAVAVLFAPRHGWAEPLSIARTRMLCLGAGIYAATFTLLPPLAHALIFVLVVALIVQHPRSSAAWASLLILSLPIIATAQFYLGYPLRLATTFLSAIVLRLGGLCVSAQATVLHWRGESVVVDAPCSGIHMLWTGLFFAAALGCWHSLNNRQTLRLLQLASLSVFLANLLRSVALFCIETKLWPSFPGAHEAVGLALFGAVAGIVALLARRLGVSTPTRPPAALPLSLP